MGKKAHSILYRERLSTRASVDKQQTRKRKPPDMADTANVQSPSIHRKRARTVAKNVAFQPVASSAAAAQQAPVPRSQQPSQQERTAKPWWPSSVIDRQAAQALTRLLNASARGHGGASIKVGVCSL